MFSRVCFFQNIQFKIFVTNFSGTDSIVAWRFATFGVNLRETVMKFEL